jgi:hypothetical protein
MRRRRRRLEPLGPEGEGRRKSNHPANRHVKTVSNPQRRIKDFNPALTETGWKCDSSHHPCLRRGATGVVGRGGAADPHGRTERSGVTSSRPTVGRSRGMTFACDGPAWPGLGRAVKTVKPRGLAPAALHSIHARRYPFLGPETHTLWVRDVHAAGPTRDVPPPRIGPSRAGAVAVEAPSRPSHRPDRSLSWIQRSGGHPGTDSWPHPRTRRHVVVAAGRNSRSPHSDTGRIVALRVGFDGQPRYVPANG